jgi:2-amino-4-hydroxy-6-hydroxymethyldihydropteridine diphosphokinase
MLGTMTIAFIALGSNLGKRQAALRAALERIGKLPQTKIIAVASFRETEPVGCGPNAGKFINSAVQVETGLSARDLLSHLLRIEHELGRQRVTQCANDPRTIDLDLLLFGSQVIHAPDIEVPHPRMHLRLFVLEPLAEIAPRTLHPPTGKTIGRLLAELQAPPKAVAKQRLPNIHDGNIK